jgi:alpha-amylase
VIKIDGFRYDYCKGFHNSHIDDYNKASEAYFSVMEYWDGDVNALQYHLNDANWNTLAFDFATKYTAFNDGIAADNYYKLKGAGLPGAGKSRYAVTFLDSHDTFQRDNNEFCGLGNSMKYPGKVQQCYAYMLSMPGVPCVFYPHWVSFKDKIKPMINARYKTGVHSESAVSDEAGNGYYKATITGTNGQIRLLVGPNSGYNSTPAGFTLAVKGENYGVYYKVNSPRGDKNTSRSDISLGTEEIVEQTPSVKAEKFMRDGKLYIRCGEQVFDITGQRIY